MRVSIQTSPFDVSEEQQKLQKETTNTGALVSFTGVVRDNSQKTLKQLFIEHYPSMTMSALEEIANQAKKRWEITGCTIIHRVGYLSLGEEIVLIITASKHRQAAFQAAEFIMDYLKSNAPFWKKELYQDGSAWVASRIQDKKAQDRWKET